MMIWLAIAVMMSCTVAHHLGLAKATSKVVTKILNCHQCLTFWTVIILLTLASCNVIISAMLALLMAYVSNWFAILLVWLNDIYNKVWQKLDNNKK